MKVKVIFEIMDGFKENTKCEIGIGWLAVAVGLGPISMTCIPLKKVRTNN